MTITQSHGIINTAPVPPSLVVERHIATLTGAASSLARPMIRIKDWDNLQHYKDRNPPWVKWHQMWLEHDGFLSLDPMQKWVFCGLLLLAAKSDNCINDDYALLSQRLFMNGYAIDLEALEKVGLIECEHDASKVLESPSVTLSLKNKREEKRREEKTEVHSSILLASFKRFWKPWPWKRAKKDAWKAWKALGPDDALVEDILAGLERDKRSAHWNRPGFHILPGTWIRGRRWEDEDLPDPKARDDNSWRRAEELAQRRIQEREQRRAQR